MDAAPDEPLAAVAGRVPGVPLAWAQGLPTDPPPADPQPPAPAPAARPAPAAQPPAPAPPTPVPPAPAAQPPAPAPTPAPAPSAGPDEAAPELEWEEEQKRGGDKRRARKPKRSEPTGGTKAPRKERRPAEPTRLRNGDGSPARSNPGFVDALPGPSFRSGVPNFVIRKFRVPIFLVADLSGGGDRVWGAVGGVGGDQRDRDRLRAQPQRLQCWCVGVDAVHPLVLAGVWGRCEQGRPQGPL